MSWLRRLPFHPPLLIGFPILSLLAANVDQVRLDVVWRPLAYSIAIGGGLWLVLFWVLRDERRSAAITSLAALLFFSYGHVYAELRGWGEAGHLLARHRYLLPLWLLLFAVTMLFLARRRRFEAGTTAFNTVSVLLVAITIAQLGSYALRMRSSAGSGERPLNDPASASPIELKAPEQLPDVYYVVLDAYGRGDVLADHMGIDNSEFLRELEALGFYVASCSQSNYAQTELAFASTLNMAYLDDLGDKFKPNRDDRTPLRPLIRNSLTRRLLENLGYGVVAFETGYPFSELDDADRYVGPTLARGSRSPRGLTGFEVLLLRSSGGLVLLDAAEVLPELLVPNVDHRLQEHRRQVLTTLDTLEDPEDLPRPRFVFAHIVAPHSPFVLGPNGQARVEAEFSGAASDGAGRIEWYRQGYADQIEYLHGRLLPILRGLIEGGATEPVIILQGDHGPEEGSSSDRMAILNAYYLPGAVDDRLHPGISPINSFRLVFDGVFGADLPLLPDKSYFSTYNRPYDFRVIPPGNCPPQ